MDFLGSNKGNKDGKKTGTSKSNPSSPPHLEDGRSPPPSYPASERVPNSHTRPHVSSHGTHEHHRHHGSDRTEEMYYEPDSNSPVSPYHPSVNRTPERRTRPRDHSRGHNEGMYEADTRSIASPFHPFPSPSPYHQHDSRRDQDADHYEEIYEPESNTAFQSRAPGSPYHPTPSPNRTPGRRSNHGKEKVEQDVDVTQGGISPPSPVHGGEQQYYSSSEEDNNSAYLYPETSTPPRAFPLSTNSTPVHHKYQMVVAEPYEHHSESSESDKMRGLEEEDMQVAITEVYVTVDKYKVKHSVAATLQTILDKHGDIAANSKLQSVMTTSYYLESLAEVVMDLRTTMLRDLTETRAMEMAAVVKDMESVKIDVSWLKAAVMGVGEAMKHFGEYDSLKVEREVCERDLKTGKEEMDEMRAELVKREKEIRECREKVTMVAGKLGQLEMKGSRLNKNLDLFQSKVDKFKGDSVLLHV